MVHEDLNLNYTLPRHVSIHRALRNKLSVILTHDYYMELRLSAKPNDVHVVTRTMRVPDIHSTFQYADPFVPEPACRLTRLYPDLSKTREPIELQEITVSPVTHAEHPLQTQQL